MSSCVGPGTSRCMGLSFFLGMSMGMSPGVGTCVRSCVAVKHSLHIPVQPSGDESINSITVRN